MSVDKVSAEWVRVWLKKHKKKNIRSIQIPFTRSFGFIDIISNDVVFFGLVEATKDLALYNLVQSTKSFQADGMMFSNWLRIASGQK